ncbi:MAG: thioredoxin domain-containing protein [Nitrospinota bacterium]
MKKTLIALSILLLFVGCGVKSGENTDIKEDIKKVLKENPEIVLDVLKENDDEILNIINGAVLKARARIEDERRGADLKTPKIPVIEKTRPVRGNPDAPVTMVEYSDFQCPFCRRAVPTVESVLEKYEGKVRLIYKHLPLNIHSFALLAAQYFEAIALQDHKKAWIFHDLVFENQKSIDEGESALKKLAEKAGADMDRLSEDVKSDEVIMQVNKDIAESKKFGFTGTPTFLINGVMLVGSQPEQAFTTIIEAALEKSGS